MKTLQSIENEIANDGGSDSDAELGNVHEGSTNSVDEGEFCCVLQDQDKCVQGRLTEVLIRQSAVDIGILVDESHETIEAVEAASDAAKKTFHKAIVTGSRCNLVSYVLKDAFDQPDDSNEQRSECNCT